MADHLCVNEDGSPRFDVKIGIPEAVNDDGVTFYIVSVKVGKIKWTSRRRYKDFLELHEFLVDCGVEKSRLPPKKIVGTRDPAFILKRRRELEAYLESVYKFLEKDMPIALLEFLQFTHYDCNYILKALSGQHYAFDKKKFIKDPPLSSTKSRFKLKLMSDNKKKEHNLEAESADVALASSTPPKQNDSSEFIKWTPLELYAISQRHKIPRPILDLSTTKYDFTNLADFCCTLPRLFIRGSDEAIGTSNIVSNELTFNLLAFKSLTSLVLQDCKIFHIESLGSIRSTLIELKAHNCGLTSINQILFCDSGEPNEQLAWMKLSTLDLSYNSLSSIDNSLFHTPNLINLRLESNKISIIPDLTFLLSLESLILSNNQITEAEDLHIKLGQVIKIDLTRNKLKKLNGFAKVYSLTDLNVSGNLIRDLESVYAVTSLPMLEYLNLQGNIVTSGVDYRLKLLEAFGKRSSEIVLDNESPSQSEIDRVSIRMALNVTKGGKSPTSLFGNLPRRV